MRKLLPLLLLMACDERVYDGNDDGMRLPGDQAGYREGREGAIEAAKIAAKAGCERLWSDCPAIPLDDTVEVSR